VEGMIFSVVTLIVGIGAYFAFLSRTLTTKDTENTKTNF
jgi:hypothetical protein